MPKSYPFYKRYPLNFIDGTVGLSLEEKGAYSILIDLIFLRGAPIPDDAKWIAGVCGCSVRKWNLVKKSLIERGKIYLDGEGNIANEVALNLVQERRAMSEKQARNRAGSRIISKLSQDKTEIISDKFEQIEPPSSNIRDLQKPPWNQEEEEEETVTNVTAQASKKGLPVKARIFNGVSAWLIEKTDLPKNRINAQLGRWIKLYGEQAVLTSALAAHDQQPIDPVAWMAASLKKRTGGAKSKTEAPPRERVDDARAFLTGVRNRNGEAISAEQFAEIEEGWPEWVKEFRASLERAASHV